MMRFSALLRSNGITSAKNLPQACFNRTFSADKSSSSSSSSSTSSDDEQKKAVPKKKSTEALDKLNLLLNKMIQDDASTIKQSKQPKLELARPQKLKRKDIRTEPGTESVKSEPIEQKVVKAVKDVAKSIGGDVKQTESELLQKLLNPVKDESTQTASGLSEIFKDMKIDRKTQAVEQASRSQQVRQLLLGLKSQQQTGRPKASDRRFPRQAREKGDVHIVEERVDLFGSERLAIFPSLEEIEKWEEPQLNKTWKTLHERELRLAVTHPPSNYFQQMILWTNQGKIWKFPIDNEQGLEVEKSVYFAEHVFLEKHLESWCPPKGPIRHFMELVCVGLSKNPYLTVEKKKEHIEWFREYFGEKQQLLREVGAVPANFDLGKKSQGEIEG